MSYSSILKDKEKYPDGSNIRGMIQLVERQEYHDGKYKAMITFHKYEMDRSELSDMNPETVERLSNVFEEMSWYCAYLNYPDDHNCSNWTLQQWEDLERDTNVELTYGESHLIGIDFNRYDSNGKKIRNMDKIRDKLQKMADYLNSHQF